MDPDNFQRVKDELQEMVKLDGGTDYTLGQNECTVLPITHNDNQIYLQFSGWCIVLNMDGTWHWECTLGG